MCKIANHRFINYQVVLLTYICFGSSKVKVFQISDFYHIGPPFGQVSSTLRQGMMTAPRWRLAWRRAVKAGRARSKSQSQKLLWLASHCCCWPAIISATTMAGCKTYYFLVIVLKLAALKLKLNYTPNEWTTGRVNEWVFEKKSPKKWHDNQTATGTATPDSLWLLPTLFPRCVNFTFSFFSPFPMDVLFCFVFLRFCPIDARGVHWLFCWFLRSDCW